jgi:hypothetical protein
MLNVKLYTKLAKNDVWFMKYTTQADKTINKIASAVPHNVVNRLYHGFFFYFQNITWFHITDICVISFTPVRKGTPVLIFRKLINALRAYLQYQISPKLDNKHESIFGNLFMALSKLWLSLFWFLKDSLTAPYH